VLGAIERLSRQRRWLRAAALGGGLLAVAVGGFFLRENLRSAEGQAVTPAVAAPAPRMAERVAATRPPAPARAGAGGKTEPPPASASRSEKEPEEPAKSDRGADEPGEAKQARPSAGSEKRERGDRRSARAAADTPPGRRVFTLNVSPVDSQYSIEGGPWRQIVGNRATVEVGPGETRISVRKRDCCVDRDTVIAADRKADQIDLALRWLPASVTPRCANPRASVRIGRRSWRRNAKFTVPIKSVTGTERVTVTFFVDGTDKVQDQDVDLRAGQSKEVRCEL
jgi:hypothetical protein